MIINEERRFALKNLTKLYSPSDFQVAVQHMPDEMSDESGERFGQYFDFLQSFYSLRGDYMLRSEEDLAERVNKVKDLAAHFGFPTNTMDFL